MGGARRVSCTPGSVPGARGCCASAVVVDVADFPDTEMEAARCCLDLLILPPSPAASGCDEAAQERATLARSEFISGIPAFEILECPNASDTVLRFRLTGKSTFNIEDSVDLAGPPYCVDVDAMNTELARLVSTAQGRPFLPLGTGLDTGGRSVISLLWPVDAGYCSTEGATSPDIPAVPPPPIFEMTLAVLRAEAESLVRRSFAHVSSCQCGS